VTGLELLVVDEFIYTRLTQDVGPGGLMTLVGNREGVDPEVYSDTIPGDVLYPYVIFTLQSTADTMTTEGTRVLTQATYMVKGVHRTESYAELGPVASRIDALLHKASGVVLDGRVLHSRRLQAVRYPEVTEAVSYRHLGGSYRFWTEAT
jgi:hypothetical protein